MKFSPIYNVRRIFTLINSVGQTKATIHDIAWVRREISKTISYYFCLDFLK